MIAFSNPVSSIQSPKSFKKKEDKPDSKSKAKIEQNIFHNNFFICSGPNLESASMNNPNNLNLGNSSTLNSKSINENDIKINMNENINFISYIKEYVKIHNEIPPTTT